MRPEAADTAGRASRHRVDGPNHAQSAMTRGMHAMYTLDLRETNLLRHALRQDGSDRALTLLGSLPGEGPADRALAGPEAETAARALDSYAARKTDFGGLAASIADGLLNRSKAPRPDYGPGRH